MTPRCSVGTRTWLVTAAVLLVLLHWPCQFRVVHAGNGTSQGRCAGAVPSFQAASKSSVAQAPLISDSLSRVQLGGKNDYNGGAGVGFNRSSSLADAVNFSFVHISKGGGASFIEWALDARNRRSNGSKTFPRFFPDQPIGIEQGLMYDVAQRPGAVRLVFLRSPRSHVMSMHWECAYSPWAARIIAQRRAKGLETVPDDGNQLTNFRSWLDHFGQAHRHTSTFGCYNPWNYQARALTSLSKQPHRATCANLEPSLDQAVEELLRVDWVGLQDFYHESLCLLVFRIDGPSHPYMQGCACTAEGATVQVEAGLSDVHDDHHSKAAAGRQISSKMELPPPTQGAVDRITAIDRHIFEIALRGFMSEIVALERRLGRRVLCNDTLQAKRGLLQYVTNVTALYALLREEGIAP